MIKLQVEEKYRTAASQLAEFGIALSPDGIPTVIEEGKDEVTVRDEGGKLFIGVQRRAQVFFALGKIAAGGDEGCRFRARSQFQKLTYMLDCSRNAVLKPEMLKKLIRYLAVMGYDALGLYMEDTYPVDGYPYFGYLRDRYSKQDLLEVDVYAALFGIEVVPYIQTLAHLSTVSRNPAMAHLFENPDILFTGKEETYRFIDAMLSSCAECFSTREIHIGMDEAYLLGRCKYLDANGYRPAYEVLTDHLARVEELCKKHGLKPMMWFDADIPLSFREKGEEEIKAVAARIPKEVSLVYWDYYSTEKEHYLERIRMCRKFSDRLMFAGGAWKWIGIAPDNLYSFAITEAAMDACIEEKIDRFIVTGWGDNGGECSPFCTLPALYHAARYSYGERRGTVFDREFLQLTGVPFEKFLTLDLANRVRKGSTAKTTAGRHLLFADPLLGKSDPSVRKGMNETYLSHSRRLSNAKRDAGRWEYLFETQYALCRVLAVKAELGVKLRAAYRAGDRAELKKLVFALKETLSRVTRLKTVFAKQWETENFPNGFDVQDLRFGALKERLKTAIQKTEEYLAGKRENIGELEEELLDPNGGGIDFCAPEDFYEGRWGILTTVNVNI